MLSLDELPRNHFGAILADPPWRWESWGRFRSKRNELAPLGDRSVDKYYQTIEATDIAAMQVKTLAAKNSVLFLWITWPMLQEAMFTIDMWGFEYKTCAFAWMKADVSTIDMFSAPKDADMKLGYWTRANSEVCLLATRGTPKRINCDVRQGIIEPARQHSRKPDSIHERIERLVAGPYLELFARQQRPGWTVWGNETDKFKPYVHEQV